MNNHQESTYTKSYSVVLSLPHLSSSGFRLLVSIVITVVICFALTLLDAWPSTTKRRLWETFVRLTPSQFIYAMEYPFRRRRRGGQGGVSFRKKDFGNQQAKSEALQRVFGFEDSLESAMQHARRLSGLHSDLGPSTTTPAGLGNWDNSCYQNSVIQSLASLSWLDEYLAQSVKRMSQDDTGSTHDALRNIISRLNHSGNEGKRLWTPSPLKSMNSWQQQDAQEYFSKIVDEVDREMCRVVKNKTNELGFGRGDGDGSSKIWQHNPFQGLLAQRVGCTRCGYTEGLSLLPFTCVTVNLGPQWEYNVRDCLDEYTALESIEGVECIKCTVLRTKASLEQVLVNLHTHDASRPPAEADFKPVSTLKKTVTERLQIIHEVCEASDFSDSGLYKKCNISAKSRVSSMKSKQAVIARAPKDLVIHVNRSIFDTSGMQRKNHARVRFPLDLQLDKWCLGSHCVKTDQDVIEKWNTSPTTSMLPSAGAEHPETGKLYKLRAVITHYGGHENGHYIAYRKRSSSIKERGIPSTDAKQPNEGWFCFNDDNVSPVSEDHVVSQGGVFMLFYEALGEGDRTSSIAAQPMMDKSGATAQLGSQVACGKSDATLSSLETFDTQDTAHESVGCIHNNDPSSDIDGSLKPSPSPELSLSSNKPKSRTNIGAHPEPTRPPSVAPIMRTAGALSSPDLRQGRRSSNISIHSPSFVTAS